MRTTEFELDGHTWHLCLNGAALFDLYDKFGTEGSLLDPIYGADRATYDNLCWILAKLAEQGEIVRRYQGLDRGGFPTEHMFRATLRPMDVLRAKRAVEMAVKLGFAREEPEEDKPVYLGRAQLEKKTGPG